MASRSSRWPFPAMPAMPRISPPCSVRLRFESTGTPSAFTQVTFSRRSRLGPFKGAARSMPSFTFSPTIISVSRVTSAFAVSTAPIYCPFRSTATRSESASTSVSLCVMIRIDLPSSRIFRRIAKRRSVSCGVSTAVGSSRIRMSAPRYRTFMISTVCFSETESS